MAMAAAHMPACSAFWSGVLAVQHPRSLMFFPFSCVSSTLVLCRWWTHSTCSWSWTQSRGQKAEVRAGRWQGARGAALSIAACLSVHAISCVGSTLVLDTQHVQLVVDTKPWTKAEVRAGRWQGARGAALSMLHACPCTRARKSGSAWYRPSQTSGLLGAGAAGTDCRAGANLRGVALGAGVSVRGRGLRRQPRRRWRNVRRRRQGRVHIKQIIFLLVTRARAASLHESTSLWR